MPERADAQILGRIVRVIGTADFMPSVALSIGQVIGFERTTFFLHGHTDRAVPLFHNVDQTWARQGIENYASYTHRFNPMLARNAGVFRAQDFHRLDVMPADKYLAPSPDEELGFLTRGWPANLEEVGLYIPTQKGVLELSFYRPRSHGQAGADCLNDLVDSSQVIAAAFERHLEISRDHWPAAQPANSLSPREEQIAGLILRGYSSQAIADWLHLSLHTVKDHRKNIFRKLHISSTAELFMLERTLGIVAANGASNSRLT
jgi:DNA-binding CsgD family transcriptional regulator